MTSHISIYSSTVSTYVHMHFSASVSFSVFFSCTQCSIKSTVVATVGWAIFLGGFGVANSWVKCATYITHWVYHLYCRVCSHVVNYYIQYTYVRSVCMCVCVCVCACVSWTLLYYYTDQPPAVHWQAYHSTSLPLSSQSWQYSWLEQQFKCWPHHPTRLYRHF